MYVLFYHTGRHREFYQLDHFVSSIFLIHPQVTCNCFSGFDGFINLLNRYIYYNNIVNTENKKYFSVPSSRESRKEEATEIYFLQKYCGIIFKY